MEEEPTPSAAQPTTTKSGLARKLASKRQVVITNTRAKVDNALPRIGDLSFGTFTTFIALLFAFTVFTNTILLVVLFRARYGDHASLHPGMLDHAAFHPIMQALNFFWIVLQAFIFGDLFYVYFRYYRPTEGDEERPKIAGSRVRKPKTWALATRLLGTEVSSRSFLLFLALLLPLNALLFYDGVGAPVMKSRLEQLEGYNVTELLADSSLRGGGLLVDRGNGDRGDWEVKAINGTQLFDPPLIISNRDCFDRSSPEHEILVRQEQEASNEQPIPKQAYCNSILGTMMADSFGEKKGPSDDTWRHDEDKWDEAFEFALRLFSSLAGVVADQSEGLNTMMSMIGFSFLKDMTDVFDMYMLTWADTAQMVDGRPLLVLNHGLAGYEWSYHSLVFSWIWIGVAVVLLRAMAVVGCTPVVYLIGRLGFTASPEHLRKPIDAFFSMVFIEIPYLMLRWIAWTRYGVPVSVMAVKNVFGIYEDLFFLGIIRGFGDDTPRGFRLLFAKPPDSGSTVEV
mmetsp:Transcript_33612/g.106710  ORF Transcript_33612/g.106710 Transcript_33612/m.106710 type:complete len:511 (-) Transcript_33612:61-1593(-)